MKTKVSVDGAIRGLLPVVVVGFFCLTVAAFIQPPMSGPFAEAYFKLLSHPIAYLLMSVLTLFLIMAMGWPTLREFLASLFGGIAGGTILLVVVALQFNSLILSLLIVLAIAPSIGTLAYCLAYRAGLKSASHK